MNAVATKDIFSRRKFLETGSVALAAAGLLSAADAGAQIRNRTQPKNDRSATDPGPGNPPLNGQNSDSAWPTRHRFQEPSSNVQISILFCEQATYEGGMVTGGDRSGTSRLEVPGRRKHETHGGGVRELQLDTADEWAIVLYGTARITAVDRDGKSFVADVKKDDLWYFPSGIHIHSRTSRPDGRNSCWYSTDGNFSESETFC